MKPAKLMLFALFLLSGISFTCIPCQATTSLGYMNPDHQISTLIAGSGQPGESTTIKIKKPGVPAWNSSTLYETGDYVTYAGRLWQANYENYDSEPSGTNLAWTDLGLYPPSFKEDLLIAEKSNTPK